MEFPQPILITLFDPPISTFGWADTLYDAVSFEPGKVLFYGLFLPTF